MSERTPMPVAPPVIVATIPRSELVRGPFPVAVVFAIACLAFSAVGVWLGQNAYDDANAGSSFVPLPAGVAAEVATLTWSIIGVGFVVAVTCFGIVGYTNRSRQQGKTVAHVGWVYFLSVGGPLIGLVTFGAGLVIRSW